MVAPGQPPPAEAPQQAAAGHGGTAPPAAGQAAAVAGGQDVIKQAAEKAQDMVIELQGLCKAWFQRIRNGLEEPYDLEQARADQEKILSLFATLSEELRKSGLENLFVDKKIKTANGEGDVQLPKLPKHILAKEPDVTSTKMIGELKTMILEYARALLTSRFFIPDRIEEWAKIVGQMTEELDALHSVAERASRSLSVTPAG